MSNDLKLIFSTENYDALYRRRRFTPLSQLQLNQYYILGLQDRLKNTDLINSLSGLLAVSDIGLQYAQGIIYANDIPSIDYAFVDENNNIYVGGIFRGTNFSGTTVSGTTALSFTTFLSVVDVIFNQQYILYMLSTIPPRIAGARLLRDDILGLRLVLVLNYRAAFTLVNPVLGTLHSEVAPANDTFVVLYINPVTFAVTNVIKPTAQTGIVQIGWNVASTPYFIQPSSFTNPSLLVAVGSGTNTLLYSSNNGVTWTGNGSTIFTTLARGTSWDGSTYIAVGSGTNSIAYSSDGINWTGIGTSVFTDGYGVMTTGNRFIAFGTSGTGEVIATSDDSGLTWNTTTSPLADNVYAGATNGTIVVAVGGLGLNGDTIIYSYDQGTTWYGAGNSVFSINGYDVAWGGSGIFVATGEGTNTLAYSFNGIAWIGLGSTIFTTRAYGVIYANGRFVAVGEGTNTIAYSSNGITWVGIGSSIFSSRGRGISFDGTNFIATGAGTNTVAYSSDGITWTGVGDPFGSGEGYRISISLPTFTSINSDLPFKTYLPLDFETNGVLLNIRFNPSASMTWFNTTYTNVTANLNFMLSTLRFNGTHLRSSTLQNIIIYAIDTDSSFNIYIGCSTDSNVTVFGRSITPITLGLQHLYMIKTNNVFVGQWDRFVVTGTAVDIGQVPMQLFVPSPTEAVLFNPRNTSNITISDTSIMNTARTDYLISTRIDTNTGTTLRQDTFPWNSGIASIKLDVFNNSICSGTTSGISLPLPYGDVGNGTPLIFVYGSTSSNDLTEANFGYIDNLIPYNFKNYFAVSVLGFDSTYYDLYTITTSNPSLNLFNNTISGILNDGITRSYIIVAQYGVTYSVV
jgi:hypothetical protein